MRILDARKPDCRALVRELRPLDYIIYSHAVYQMRGDGHHTQSHLISNDPEQWLESVRLEKPAREGVGRLLASMHAQFPELAEVAAQEAVQPEEWEYDMMTASFLDGTGRV